MTTMELTLSLVLVLLVCLIARLLLAAAQRKSSSPGFSNSSSWKLNRRRIATPRRDLGDRDRGTTSP